MFIFLGFFLIFNTKCLHAFPGIDLDARKNQLEEEKK
ncbi:hypothetical protein ['Chrysanthemum coronarium' phytoplasma]|nr:hypothetical protein ['Chrysanthemum coronarium' phytoplasma]